MRRLLTSCVLLTALSGCVVVNNTAPTGLPPSFVPTKDLHISLTTPSDARIGYRSNNPKGFGELLLLSNGGIVAYGKLNTGYFPYYTDSDALRVDMGINPALKQMGIAFDPTKVKNEGIFSYIVQSSDRYNCFSAHTDFGGYTGHHDQRITVGQCVIVTNMSAGDLETVMLGILHEIRIDGAPLPDSVE